LSFPDIIRFRAVTSPLNFLAFAVPPPSLELSLVTGTQLMVVEGIVGTKVSLLGVATLDPAVDSQVSVSTFWSRHDVPGVMSSSENTNATLTFNQLSFIDSGDYLFTVSVSPSNPAFVKATPSVNASYTMNVQPYPDLVVVDTESSGECDVDERTTLMGHVTLLPNIGANHSLTYRWTVPSTATDNLIMNGGVLEVRSLMTNVGNYTLLTCLTFPGAEYCNTTEYVISTEG
jgi:hypothetical protein